VGSSRRLAHRAIDAAGYALLAAGPVALLFRRRFPVEVLAFTFAARVLGRRLPPRADLLRPGRRPSRPVGRAARAGRDRRVVASLQPARRAAKLELMTALAE
jgi:hypothetical protein